MPSVIENTIRCGEMASNKTIGRRQFFDAVNNITVVTENNKVITATYGQL